MFLELTGLKIKWNGISNDQIVRTVDYSDDPAAQAALNRPQYIQLNFANWWKIEPRRCWN